MKTTLNELKENGHSATTPLELNLPNEKGDEEILIIQKTLRVLPKKRFVAKAYKLNDKQKAPILAKIFFQLNNFQHEVKAYQQLKDTGVKTPKLLHQQATSGGGICYYQYLENIVPFDKLWAQSNQEEQHAWLNKLLDIFEILFTGGMAQKDCHLGNFVAEGETLYALDPADCVTTTEGEFLYIHLAELPAQFLFIDIPLITEAIYKRFSISDKPRFEQAVNKAWLIRKKAFLKKIFRDCSLIADISDDTKKILCRRSELSDDFTVVLKNPDAAMERGEIIKDSSSTTVAKIQVNNKCYVIKRYNKTIKSAPWRALFSTNRARNNWYFSHLLEMAGIFTPQPCAVIQKGRGFFSGRSYFINEFINTKNALQAFRKAAPNKSQLQEISKVFSVLDNLKIKHGDCKSANWLVDGDNMWLVDLDAMAEVRDPGKADRKRFLKDWKNTPKLFSDLKGAINKGKAKK